MGLYYEICISVYEVLYSFLSPSPVFPTLLIVFLFPTSFLSKFHVFFTAHWVYLGLGYLEVKGHLQEHGQLINGYIITEEYFLLSNINGL